ncbi:MAG: GSCFA domain-containing protein, partial [Vitreimonas sp.]
SAAYGHIYTARQFLQLLLRGLGRFKPAEDRWRQDDAVIDPFRPGLRWPAWSDREFDLLTRQHLDRTVEALQLADVFIFTLGLTECWASAKDGAVYPACPGTIAGVYDPLAHTFVNMSTADVKADLTAILATLAAINPKLRIVLTVSPVPLVATATPGHVVAATIYSKSALVAAAVEAAREHAHVVYFPSYEIVTGPQAPERFFEADRRNVSAEGVDTVMRVLLAHCEGGGPQPSVTPQAPADLQALSQAIAAAECEEMAVERPSKYDPAPGLSACGISSPKRRFRLKGLSALMGLKFAQRPPRE